MLPTETAEDNPLKPLTHVQRAFSNAVLHAAYLDIIDDPTVPAYARARLRSATGGGSSCWFRDITTARAAFVTRQQLIANIRQLQGLLLTD